MVNVRSMIREIEKYPIIYDSDHEYCNDNLAKSVAWNQVCEAVVPEWQTFNKEHKRLQEIKIRRKWRNVRDHFIKVWKAPESKENAKIKRKKYIYHDQLLFLMPSLEKKKNRTDNNSSEQSVDNSRSSTPAKNDHQCQNEVKVKDENEEEEKMEETEEYKNHTVEFPGSVCEVTLTVAQDDEYGEVFSSQSCFGQQQQAIHESDFYDRMFLLSLVPMMHRLPEEYKHSLRISLLQVIADAINNYNSAST